MSEYPELKGEHGVVKPPKGKLPIDHAVKAFFIADEAIPVERPEGWGTKENRARDRSTQNQHSEAYLSAHRAYGAALHDPSTPLERLQDLGACLSLLRERMKLFTISIPESTASEMWQSR